MGYKHSPGCCCNRCTLWLGTAPVGPADFLRLYFDSVEEDENPGSCRYNHCVSNTQAQWGGGMAFSPAGVIGDYWYWQAWPTGNPCATSEFTHCMGWIRRHVDTGACDYRLLIAFESIGISCGDYWAGIGDFDSDASEWTGNDYCALQGIHVDYCRRRPELDVTMSYATEQWELTISGVTGAYLAYNGSYDLSFHDMGPYGATIPGLATDPAWFIRYQHASGDVLINLITSRGVTTNLCGHDVLTVLYVQVSGSFLLKAALVDGNWIVCDGLSGTEFSAVSLSKL